MLVRINCDQNILSFDIKGFVEKVDVLIFLLISQCGLLKKL